MKVNVDPTLPSKLYGDDIRIRQILVNLLTNGIKYTRKGTVTFEVTGEKDGADVILHFVVRDTGVWYQTGGYSKAVLGF